MIWVAVALYGFGAVGTFIYNGCNSYGPLRWHGMFLSALIWPIALPALVDANRGS